ENRLAPMDPELSLRVAERYANGSRAARSYVATKLRSDPIVRRLIEIGEQHPYGHVADIGCGRGQCVVSLLEAGVASGAIGFDWDGQKIEQAKRAATGLNTRFEQIDVRELAIPPCDSALLIDVLHYMKAEEQDALLERVAHGAQFILVR